MKRVQRVLPFTPLLLAALFIFNPLVNAQSVVSRAHLGSSVEGITYITTGPYANSIAVLDCMDLIVLPGGANGSAPPRKLFSFEKLGFVVAPRGISYIESEKLFIVSEMTTTKEWVKFYFVDFKGKLVNTIVFHWPEQELASGASLYVEGVAWIPPDAPKYGGDIAFAVMPKSGVFTPELIVMTRNGELVTRISVPDPSWMAPLGLAYRTPGRLLIGDGADAVWEMDLDGNLTSGPALLNATGFEGITALPGNKVAVTTHALGRLLFLDVNLQATGRERIFQSGLGVNGLYSAIAWKSDSNEFLLYRNEFDFPSNLPQVVAINSDFKSTRMALNLAPLVFDPEWMVLSGLDYVPGSGRIVIAKRNPGFEKELLFFDAQGNWTAEVVGGGAYNRISRFSYIASADQFAIRRVDEPRQIAIYWAPWGFLRTLDLSPYIPSDSILDIAWIPGEDGPGSFIVLTTVGTKRQILHLDWVGNLLETYSLSFMEPTLPSSMKAITTGSYAGKFVTFDVNRNDLIIFDLN